jgi:hypothetical protein
LPKRLTHAKSIVPGNKEQIHVRQKRKIERAEKGDKNPMKKGQQKVWKPSDIKPSRNRDVKRVPVIVRNTQPQPASQQGHCHMTVVTSETMTAKRTSKNAKSTKSHTKAESREKSQQTAPTVQTTSTSPTPSLAPAKPETSTKLTALERLGRDATEFASQAPPELVAARLELSEAIERFNRPDCTDIPLWFEREIDQWMGRALWERVRGEDITNRKLTEAQIYNLKKDMLSGDWDPNGENLKITPAGQVLDGQGRIGAYLEALRQKPGLTIITDIRFRVPAKAFKTVDTGRGRTASDLFGMLGISNGFNIAAIARLWHSYHRGTMRSQPKLSPTKLIEVVTSDPEQQKLFIDAHHLAIRSAKDHGIMPAVAGFIAALALRANKAKAEAFFTQLEKGTNLNETDPAYVLARALKSRTQADESTGRKRRSRRMADRIEVAAIMIKALNAHFSGKKIKQLRWIENEAFPDFVGDAGRGIPNTEKYKALPVDPDLAEAS